MYRGWLVDVGRAFGVPEHQLVHVPYGMHHDTFALRNSSRRSIDVAMLYHPLREKGWDVGRQVLERLAQQRPGFAPSCSRSPILHRSLSPTAST